MLPTMLTGGLLIVAIGVVAEVALGMFTNVPGGGQSFNSWIAWHAVLMASAYPCLMTLGRWVYVAEGDLLDSVLAGKTLRRRLHRNLMTVAVLAALGGYFSIFESHLPIKKFFGYNFVDGAWAAWPRIV